MCPLYFPIIIYLMLLSLLYTDTPISGAGEIRGTVTIVRDDGSDLLGRQFMASRYYSRHYYSVDTETSPSSLRYSLPEKTVIYLEPIEPETIRAMKPSSERVILDQKNLMFYPQVLAIQKGTTVIFPNNDEVYHNVFSYSQPKQFDLGRYPKGQFRTVQFSNPGVVRIYCDIHAHMNAVILILESPYFITPDENGKYVIPQIPPGRYTVNFWYGRNLVESRETIVYPERTTIVDFTY